MKRPGKLLKIVSLLAAAYVVGYGLFLLLKGKKPPEVGERTVVKEFSFQSPEDLGDWEEKVLAEGNTHYSFTELDGKKCVKASSEDSASALYYRQRLSCRLDPFISWDWKAGKFPSFNGKEAIDKKANFDFVAQVYVIFDARFFLNAKAIQYVWTKDVPAGTVSRSPYTKNVMIVVLESGESETWKHEERDIGKDYRELFGEDMAKDMVAVSFMTDADSTDSTAEAFYGNITIGYLGNTPREDVPAGEKTP